MIFDLNKMLFATVVGQWSELFAIRDGSE